MHTWRLLKEEKEELSCTQIRAVKLFILTGTEEGWQDASESYWNFIRRPVDFGIAIEELAKNQQLHIVNSRTDQSVLINIY